jgi:cation:H+ antiporter
VSGQAGLALGNVIGSNIANVLLVVGVCALIYPIRVAPRTVYRDGLLTLAGTLVFVALVRDGVFDRAEGMWMLAILLVYSIYAAWAERFRGDPAGEVHIHEAEAFADGPRSLAASLAYVGAGLGGVLVGAELVVDGAVDVARALGVSEVVIGLSLVAFGTSLPELATGVIAAVRRQVDVTIGNVLGSNLFNLFGIMGTTALVTPVAVPWPVIAFDAWAMSVVMAVFFVMLITGWRLSRFEGGLLFIAYVAYIGFLLLDETRFVAPPPVAVI